MSTHKKAHLVLENPLLCKLRQLRVKSLGLKDQELREQFRVQGLGLRVWGCRLGFRSKG